MSYVLPCEFRETQVEKQIASHLGALSIVIGQQFHLLDADESTSGADAKLSWKAVTYYFQFKRPFGLKSVAIDPLPKKKRQNEAKSQDIRRYRAALGLSEAPNSLAFQLRKKAATAVELQHNLLMAHNTGGPGVHAAYICPLELELDSYLKSSSGGIQLCPPAAPICWQMVAIMNQPDILRTLAHVVNDVPAFHAHIAIPPHKTVTTHDHYYSFSRHGSDLAFHSEPEIVEGRGGRLSSFLASSLSEAALRYDELPTLRTLGRLVADRAERLESVGVGRPRGDDEGSWLLSYGRSLHRQHGIRQLVFVFPEIRH